MKCENPACSKLVTNKKNRYCSKRCGWTCAPQPRIGHNRSPKGSKPTDSGDSWWLNGETFYEEAAKRFPVEPIGLSTTGWGGDA